MAEDTQETLRALPAVHAVMAAVRAGNPREASTSTELLAHLARVVLDRCRSRLRRKGQAADRRGNLTLGEIAAAVVTELAVWRRGSATCRVVNGTGIILHSGLGRAVLPDAVITALQQAGGYVLLEVDTAEGRRRRRDLFIEELLCKLTGAEAAFTVNNNAAATMIILNTLAAGRNVVVSRSQMVEIGGSFRLPDVMEMSGTVLREVGTTNRSYVADYESAIDADTGALLLVHTSNYRIIGFTEHVGIEEMVRLGNRRGLPVIHDIGSGSLVPGDVLGIGDEPPVQASVKCGADVICFSGDKMIGGTQAGIIVGKAAWIDKIRANPLARAMRIDKLTCIALEAALKLYFEPEHLLTAVPTLRMLREPPERLEERAGALGAALRKALDRHVAIELVAETSETGAGSLPAVGLPTTCVAIEVVGRKVGDIAHALRNGDIPVFTRVKGDRVLIDPRTLLPGDDDVVVAAFKALVSKQEDRA